MRRRRGLGPCINERRHPICLAALTFCHLRVFDPGFTNTSVVRSKIVSPSCLLRPRLYVSTSRPNPQLKLLLPFLSITSLPLPFNRSETSSALQTFIDGDAGILRYRGFAIEELAEKSTFLESAYLLLYGELPTRVQKAFFETEVTPYPLLV